MALFRPIVSSGTAPNPLILTSTVSGSGSNVGQLTLPVTTLNPYTSYNVTNGTVTGHKVGNTDVSDLMSGTIDKSDTNTWQFGSGLETSTVYSITIELSY